LAALVAVVAPPRLPAAVLDQLMHGLAGDARRAGVDVVGGDLAAARQRAITVPLVGGSGRPRVTPGGARPRAHVRGTRALGGGGPCARPRGAAVPSGRRCRSGSARGGCWPRWFAP